jgi:hypothetical protein
MSPTILAFRHRGSRWTAFRVSWLAREWPTAITAAVASLCASWTMEHPRRPSRSVWQRCRTQRPRVLPSPPLCRAQRLQSEYPLVRPSLTGVNAFSATVVNCQRHAALAGAERPDFVPIEDALARTSPPLRPSAFAAESLPSSAGSGLVSSPVAIRAIMTARAFTSAGRRSPFRTARHYLHPLKPPPESNRLEP